MKKLAIPLLVLCGAIAFNPCDAQLLKKMKDKVNKVLNTDESTQTTTTNAPTTGTNQPTNRTGAGLSNTPPPDVTQQITEAGQVYEAKKYSDARYAVQQALMGVEIQLGRELLKSLPNDVNGLPKDTAQDKVVSTQWGWTNMTIQRVYSDGKDKQLTVTIGNNAFYMGLVNMYFNNTYVEANNQDQNVKPVKVKGYKALIQYDESKGYGLIVPIGQSSMIVWECVNFKDENEVMNAANSFDIDGIKKMLGEQ